MRSWLPLLHLALAAVIIVWNIVLAGRMAHVRTAPRSFSSLTALCGFMLAPAVVISLASSTMLTGRPLGAVDWVWPATAVLFMVQAFYALSRRLVHPLLGVPIALYDAIIATTVVLRYLAGRGISLPDPAFVLLAAENDAITFIAGATTLANPLFFLVPMISPAFPALREYTAVLRGILAFLAASFTTLVGLGLPRGQAAMESYRRYGDERLTERPGGDFLIGLKIFPDLRRPPPAVSAIQDLALLDTLGLRAVRVVVVPGVSGLALDSVAVLLEPLRRGDSTRVIVAIGYRGTFLPRLRAQRLDDRARLRTVDQVVRRLRPDILIPAEEPYGLGARMVGNLPPERWQAYMTEASALAKRLRPRTRIGFEAASFGRRDSTLYAWAAAAGSPIDVLGFSLLPQQLGAQALDANRRSAARWMRATETRKDHWVFSTGGYPTAHGERSQERAIWGTLAWATQHPQIRGVIISDASDYATATGLRGPTRRLRSAAYAVMRAQRGLSDAVAADSLQDQRGRLPADPAAPARPADATEP
jgi:hypothetical protein